MMRLVCLLTLTLRVGSRWKIAAVGCLHLDIFVSSIILTVMLMVDLNTLIGNRRYGDVLTG